MQRIEPRSVWAAGLLLTVVAGSCFDTAATEPAPASSSTPNVDAQRGMPSAGTSPSSNAGSGMVGASGSKPVTAFIPMSRPGTAGTPGNATMAAAGQSGAPSATAPAAVGGAPATTAPMAESNGKQPKLPAAPASCPTIATGMIMVMGQQVRLWVGPQKGPMVFYWHGTGSRAEEAIGGIGPGLNEVMSQGGVVASFTTTTMMGRTTGNNVWYTTDFEMADQILACAHQQGLIDPQRIYSAGCSAGGIHTSSMAYYRSSYLAASAPNSGGIVFPSQLEDAMHVPYQISSHGAREKDLVRSGQANAMLDVYFADITANNNKDLVAKGGFAVNCDHGGEHCANPPALTAAMWQFLKAHTFDTETSPYAAGLTAEFPAYCQIVK